MASFMLAWGKLSSGIKMQWIFHGHDPIRRDRCDDGEYVFLLLNLDKDLQIQNLVLFLVQNLNPPHAVQSYLPAMDLYVLQSFMSLFNDNNNTTFYCFWGVSIIMVILTVVAYGTDEVGIVSPTLKMKVLRLREVSGLPKVTQLVKIGLALKQLFSLWILCSFH